MRSVITLSLPKITKSKIDKIGVTEQLPRSQIIQLAINDYLAKYEFRQLRRKLVKQAKIQKVYTDEDVFDRVS